MNLTEKACCLLGADLVVLESLHNLGWLVDEYQVEGGLRAFAHDPNSGISLSRDMYQEEDVRYRWQAWYGDEVDCAFSAETASRALSGLAKDFRATAALADVLAQQVSAREEER